MTIKLLAIGKTDNTQLQTLIADYQKRLGHYIKFDFEIIPDLKKTKNLSEIQQKQKEGELILSRINSTDKLILLDENGKQVYGPAFVSREFAVQQGLCRYITNTESALKSPIVGSNPLLVKGLRAEGTDRSTVVISNTDASRLLSMSENLAFLKQCRVIIVTD